MAKYLYKLTIIIPHFNSPILLGNLLSTIPNRDFIQIIVIDDNSDNHIDSYLLVKEHYSKHVNFYSAPKGKKGAGACRNIGLEKAQGKWLLFADADDFFVEGFADIVLKYTSVTHDVIFFKPTSIFLETGTLAERHISYEEVVANYSKNDSHKNELWLKYKFGPPWSKMYRHSLIKSNNIQFDEIIFSNDIMFSTLVSYYAKNIYATNETIYCVTDSDGTLTKNKSINTYFIRLEVSMRRHRFLLENLSNSDFKSLRLGGRGNLWVVINHKLGFKVFLKTLIILIKNRVPLFYLEDLKLLRFKKL